MVKAEDRDFINGQNHNEWDGSNQLVLFFYLFI